MRSTPMLKRDPGAGRGGTALVLPAHRWGQYKIKLNLERNERENSY